MLQKWIKFITENLINHTYDYDVQKKPYYLMYTRCPKKILKCFNVLPIGYTHAMKISKVLQLMKDLKFIKPVLK